MREVELITWLNSNVYAWPLDGEEGPHDASFQCDPEHYQYWCLSSEEAWNFLDSQARDAGRALKVSSYPNTIGGGGAQARDAVHTDTIRKGRNPQPVGC